MDSGQFRQTREGLFVPVGIDPTGRAGPTKKGAASPLWRRSSRARYVPASVRSTPEQRVLEASVVLPEHGGVTGWAALLWAGGPWFNGFGSSGLPRPVCLVTAGDDVRAQPGIAVSAERLDPRDLVILDGLRMTSAVRSVCFEMRYAETLWQAVQVMDMAAYSDLVSIDEALVYARLHPGWTGIPQCRLALALAAENAWSPQETIVRLVWVVIARLPPLLCNHPVFDLRGRHLGTPDLIDVESGMIVEYDGPAHLDLRRRRKDIGREEAYRRVGLEYLTVLRPHLADQPALARRMHAVRERAAFAPEGSREWTVEPPSWWVPTDTVARRRALPAERRPKLLGYREPRSA